MATKLRLPSTGTPLVSPTLQSYTHTGSTRLRLPPVDTSALTTTTLTPDAADDLIAGDTFFAQFVSDPMVAGIAFTSGDAITVNVQSLEAGANNNLFVQLYVSIVDRAGTSVQRIIRTKVVDGTEVATSLTARSHATTQSGATYTTVAGDRIVVELSLQGTPVNTGGVQGHNGSLRFGSDGASGDLANNDTDTSTALNPWIQFVPAIQFEQPTTTSRNEWATELPRPRRAASMAALTIAVNLLQSTLTPAPVVPVYTTQQDTPIRARGPVPPWEPPNLQQSTLTPAATYYTQQDTPLRGRSPAPPWSTPNLSLTTLKGLHTLVADPGSYVVTGADATETSSARPILPIDWVIPRRTVQPHARLNHTAYFILGDLVNSTMDALAGSYTVSGADTTLVAGYSLPATAGSYAVTGSPITTINARLISASAGGYVVTGADLGFGYSFGADAGSYAVTGADSIELAVQQLTAILGDYAVTGSPATLLATRVLAADAGSYAIAGPDITTGLARAVSADAGAYTVTGADATEIADRLVVAGPGSYALTGADITVLTARVIVTTAGVYAITSADANLVVLSPNAISTEIGGYTISGAPATVIADRVLSADAGSYAIAGADASLVHGLAPAVVVVTWTAPAQTISGTGVALYPTAAVISQWVLAEPALLVSGTTLTPPAVAVPWTYPTGVITSPGNSITGTHALGTWTISTATLTPIGTPSLAPAAVQFPWHSARAVTSGGVAIAGSTGLQPVLGNEPEMPGVCLGGEISIT